MIRALFRIVLVLAVLSTVALVSALTTMHFAIHGAEVRVPDLGALTVSEARHKAADAGLQLRIADHFYSAAVPAERIATQSPLPGAVVRSGGEVRVSQSLGAQRVAVPNVLGASERGATLALRRAGLQLGTIAHLPYTLAQPGTVIAQSPDAGSASVDRPNVSLLLSSPVPPGATGYVMPEFVNQSEKVANAAVTKAGLRLAIPLYRQAEIPASIAIATPGEAPAPPSLPVVPGTVIGQEPPAGSRIDSAATVQFTIAQ